MSFWFINASLVLLVLLFLLKPLFARSFSDAGRDVAGGQRGALLTDRLAELAREHSVGLIGDAEYAQAKQETEAAYAACSDEWTPQKSGRTPVAAIAAVLVLVTGAAVAYFYYSDGYRLAFAEERLAAVMAEFEETRAVLVERLKEQPQDNDARQLLAELNYRFGDYAGAVAEYRRVDESGALEDPAAWIDYADALLRAGGAAQGARVLHMLDRVIANEPGDQRALFLAGMLSFEHEDYPRAAEYWQSLLALVPEEETQMREELQALIDRAQQGRASSPEDAADGAVDKSAKAITVTVSLADSLQARTQPGDTVFVYARAIDGPPMPLAIVRLSVADLPAEVRLDESSAMMAGMSLATFDSVEIIARVSRQGQAIPAAGDLIGSVSPVAVGNTVEVRISEIVE